MAAGELLQLDPGTDWLPRVSLSPREQRSTRGREKGREREKGGPPRKNLDLCPCSPSNLHPHPHPHRRHHLFLASELRFRFELRKNVTATLSLHNPGSDRVAFKLKTTAPKKFAVRPSSGIVEPGTTKEVHVSFFRLSFF